jgi:Glycosyltransferase
MRVVHYIWSGNIGGIERLAIWLACEQNKRQGLESSILVGSRKGLLLETLEVQKIPHSIIGLRNGWSLNASSLRMIRSAIRQADVVHIHTFHPWVLWCATWLRKPVVYTLHGNFSFGRKIRIADRIHHALIRCYLNYRADAVTFNSAFTAETAQKRYGLRRVRQELIYNGVDFRSVRTEMDEQTRQIAEKLKGRFVIGTISRFAGFKRIDRLIDAFAHFAKSNTDAVLLLSGDGVERRNLEVRVDQLKLGNRVLFTGYQKNPASLQSLMDVCVYPSENEPFGLVAVESLYLGKPVIVFSDSGGLAEIISGLTPENIVNNEAEAALRMGYYYINRDSAIEAGKRKEYAMQFSVEKMEERFFRLYQSLLKND